VGLEQHIILIAVQSQFQLGPLFGNCPKTLTAFLICIFNPESCKNKKWLQHEGIRQARTTGSSRTTLYVARGGIWNEKMSFNPFPSKAKIEHG
jgi:hypothetical protein